MSKADGLNKFINKVASHNHHGWYQLLGAAYYCLVGFSCIAVFIALILNIDCTHM